MINRKRRDVDRARVDAQRGRRVINQLNENDRLQTQLDRETQLMQTQRRKWKTKTQQQRREVAKDDSLHQQWQRFSQSKRVFNSIASKLEQSKVLRDYWNRKFRNEKIAKDRTRLINTRHIIKEHDLNIDDLKKMFMNDSTMQRWVIDRDIAMSHVKQFKVEFKFFKSVWKLTQQITIDKFVDETQSNDFWDYEYALSIEYWESLIVVSWK